MLDQIVSCAVPVHTRGDRGAAGHDPTHHQILTTAPLWPLSTAGTPQAHMARGCSFRTTLNTFTLINTIREKMAGFVRGECQLVRYSNHHMDYFSPTKI